MVIKDILWLLNNTKLANINLELGNLPLRVFVIEDVKPERELIKTIRQTKSHIILDEVYSIDKIGLAFYKNRIHRYLIRCIEKNSNNNKNTDIIIILNDDFGKYYKLKKINYERDWANLLDKIKDTNIQDFIFSKSRNKQKLINSIKNNYMILTDCAKLSKTSDFVALSNNMIKDQVLFLYEKRGGIIIDAKLIWHMFSLKLNIIYSNELQEMFKDVSHVLQETIRINITIDDIYSLLLLENIINTV